MNSDADVPLPQLQADNRDGDDDDDDNDEDDYNDDNDDDEEEDDEDEEEDEDGAVLNKLLRIADQHRKLPVRQRLKIVVELAPVFLAATAHGGGENHDDDDDDVDDFAPPAVADIVVDDDDADDNADADNDAEDEDDEHSAAAADVDVDVDVDDEDEDEDDDDDNEADQVVLELLVALVKETLATKDDSNSNSSSIVVKSAREFVAALGTDIHDMVTDQGHAEEGYAGLDSTRDTEDEVDTALRLYPEVLAQRRERGGCDSLPIYCIISMIKNRTWKPNRLAIGFVPLFAQLAIEYQLFDEEERGGLLIDINAENNTTDIVNALNFLLHTYSSDDEENEKLVDTIFLAVLDQLRGSDLLEKEDIERYHLVHEVCNKGKYFAEKRFHFLTEWDPSSLLRLGVQGGKLPLHYSGWSIRQFQVMLDTYFRYFDNENVICLLFQKDMHGRTPFEYACKLIHRQDVTNRSVHNAVEEALNTSRSFPLLDIGTGLEMAATNDNIALDGVYYYIRRQPNIILTLLRHTTSPLAPLAPSSP